MVKGEFLTRNLHGSRKKLWVLLNQGGYVVSDPDPNVKAESLRLQTATQVVEAQD